MAVHTFVSTVLESFVAEAARQVMNTEAALATPLADVTMTIGTSTLTINASLPFVPSVLSGDGSIKNVITDRTPGETVVLTSTPLSAITANGLCDVLAAAIMQLDAAENTKIAGGATLPTGVGASYSFANGTASLSAVLPITVTIDASGHQVVNVTPYLA